MAPRPTHARGLAWIDPAVASGPLGALLPADTARPARLRWTADEAEARVDASDPTPSRSARSD